MLLFVVAFWAEGTAPALPLFGASFSSLYTFDKGRAKGEEGLYLTGSLKFGRDQILRHRDSF